MQQGGKVRYATTCMFNPEKSLFLYNKVFPPALDFITRILWSICINLTFRLYLVLLSNWQFTLLSSFYDIMIFNIMLRTTYDSVLE